ncbi:hypothetical protein BDK51DRAFT_48026, partial [Blyttiomyces helicus]
LRQYLASYLQSQRLNNANSNQRFSAREKLTRLTKQQFTELSTDVFDELSRRLLNSNDVPFLAVRDDFHPKRNQARQKLATLPSNRFKDLASDVYFEIERRFPAVVQQYNLKYGEKSEPRNNQYGGLAPIPGAGSVSASTLPEPEAKQVQVTHASPSGPATQTYETQFVPIADVPVESRSAGSRSVPDAFDSQQQNISPAARSAPDVGAVNFTSLDNLMADLGSMLTYPKGVNGDSAHLDKIADLEEKLAAQLALNAEQGAALAALEAKHSKLKEDFESLQDDYNNQQQIANDIRSEATNLLEEIKSLSRKNEELLVERDNYAVTIRNLTEEASADVPITTNLFHVDRFPKYQLSQYRMDNGASPPGPGRQNSNLDYAGNGLSEEDGIVHRGRVTAYQNAVDDLLRAARSDQPTSVLVAMKAIVIACKNITEDTESFENSSSSLTSAERDDLADMKNKLSVALTSLMTAAKNHATGFAKAEVALVDTAATNLTATIVGLLKLVRSKEGQSPDEGDYDDHLDGDAYRRDDERSESYEIDELKIFLEKQTDQIVQAIQTLLTAMRSQNSVGQEFTMTVSGITSIVDSLVGVSRRTLSRPSAADFRSQGEMILRDLSDANLKLEELGRSMVEAPQSKTLKQRLASSSYEIAKYVKELISLIE